MWKCFIGIKKGPSPIRGKYGAKWTARQPSKHRYEPEQSETTTSEMFRVPTYLAVVAMLVILKGTGFSQ
jgi:hypothetical protein